MAEPVRLRYPAASARPFSHARAHARAARALEGGRENPAGRVKDRSSGQNRPASAPRNPRRPVPRPRRGSGYPAGLTMLPVVLERETAGPSRRLRRLPSTIHPRGRAHPAAPCAALLCSKQPCLRSATVVAILLRALALASHRLVDRSLDGAPDERREKHVRPRDVSGTEAVDSRPVE